MKNKLFGTWVGYWLFMIWALIVFGLQNYFEYESDITKIISLITALIIFGLGIKFYSWFRKRTRVRQ